MTVSLCVEYSQLLFDTIFFGPCSSLYIYYINFSFISAFLPFYLKVNSICHKKIYEYYCIIIICHVYKISMLYHVSSLSFYHLF